jgi:hypothetical protein
MGSPVISYAAFLVVMLFGALCSSSRLILLIAVCCGGLMAGIGGLVALFGWLVQLSADPFSSGLGSVRAMLFGGVAIALGAGSRLAYGWLRASFGASSHGRD